MDTGAEYYRRYLAGDDEGLAELVRLYRDSLAGYLAAFVGDSHTAEDLTEDTFVRLVTKKPKFRGDAAFKTWLFAIGHRVALDYLRRARRRQTLPMDAAADLPTDDDLHTLWEQRECSAVVRQALRRLPPAYRQALWLVYYEDYNHNQVAAVMGKSVHSVDTLLYRARIALRQQLEQEGVTYEDL